MLPSSCLRARSSFLDMHLHAQSERMIGSAEKRGSADRMGAQKYFCTFTPQIVHHYIQASVCTECAFRFTRHDGIDDPINFSVSIRRICVQVVYLDSDVIVLQNIDDLFRRPSLSASCEIRNTSRPSLKASCEISYTSRPSLSASLEFLARICPSLSASLEFMVCPSLSASCMIGS